MTPRELQVVAPQVSDISLDNEKLQNKIQELNCKTLVELEQVKALCNWLEGKRQSRQSARIVGESRTGKTMACHAYMGKHNHIQELGKPPIVPVVYIHVPPECSAKDLFKAIIGYLKYQMAKGTVAEVRDRTIRVLRGCKVEMLIIDEADRLKPKTFAEVRDIFDKLEIAVILVGTNRLNIAISRDEQVYNRFCICYCFGKLSKAQFKQTVIIWERRVLDLPLPSNLSGNEMLTALEKATGGYIGILDAVLRETAILALKKGLQRIDLATLQEVSIGIKPWGKKD